MYATRTFALLILVLIITIGKVCSQNYEAGFTTIILKDSSRTYKPGTDDTDPLHFRPVELDIWYPAENPLEKPLLFVDLFKLFEERSVRYDDTQDFEGLINELAQFYVAELGLGNEADQLLKIESSSYRNAKIAVGKHPVILYMAGFNGMGFENYKVLEDLAKHGFVVISIWSVGRYPGNMTNQKEDLLEQVYDAEFAIEYLRADKSFSMNSNKMGVLGCSWGGMSAAVLADKIPEIRSMVSLDGSETHYYGETDTNLYYNDADGNDNDRFIRDIFDSKLVNPEKQQIQYLYFESGDKLNDYTPTEEFHYFKKLNSEKYYLRFTRSEHADFSCIPSILRASEKSVNIYDVIYTTTVKFFQHSLKGEGKFREVWPSVKTLENTTDQPFDWTIPEDKENMTLSGHILDLKTNAPLPYVNVGVLNQEIGTVTDKQGYFKLEIPENLARDTVRISMIGYTAIEAIFEDLETKGDSITIKLEEEISELEEVVLTAKSFKKKTLGNTTRSKFLGTGFAFNQLGAEMGVKINVRKPAYVDAFNFFVSHNRLSAKSVFRLNFYTVDKGKPLKNILRHQILIPIEPKQTGDIRVDLKPYRIVLEEDVIVTIEWVDNLGVNNAGEAIYFSLGLLNSGTLYKRSSQARFKKHSSFGVGFNLDVRI